MVCNRLVLLLTLGYWFLAACVPSAESAATIPATRAVATTPTLVAVDGRPSPAATIPPTTGIIITNPATATPTPISTADVQATITAVYAAEAAEAATLFAPTPTFTPVPGPIWPIFFRAIPCRDGITTCDDSLAMDYRFAGYIINSDGSQLTPITDLGFPADLSHPVFSPDGTKLAYRALGSDDGKWHLFLTNADSTEAKDLGTGNFFDYQFIPEIGCLITGRFASSTLNGNVVIEKRCIGESQLQELEVVTFPVFYEIHFSPRGDALLVYGQDSSQQAQLLVHDIGGDTRLIYSSASEYFTGAARWLPDGQKIEFTGTGYFTPSSTVTATFNLIERDGSNLETRLNIVADLDVSEGTWSPDGQQFAFTSGNYGTPEESGLYILDLNTGEWRQVLSHFYLGSDARIGIWKQDAD